MVALEATISRQPQDAKCGGQCQLLAKDDAKTVASAEVYIGTAMLRLLVRQLA